MKNIPLLILSALLCMAANKTLAQSWSWSRHSISPDWQPEQMVTATDKWGNVYTAGNSGGTTTVTFGTVILDSLYGGANGFIVKYDSSGNVRWGKRFTVDVEFPGSISIDDSGNVYMAGQCTTNSVFCGDTMRGNLFLIKLDSSGNYLWKRCVTGCNQGFAITEPNGNTYIMANFYADSVVLGHYTLVNNSPGSSKTDILLAKYDPAGNVIWAKKEGGVNNDIGFYATFDASGNFWMAGYYDTSACVFGSFTLPAPIGQNIFIAKFDTAGTVLLAKHFDNPGSYYWENSSALCLAGDAYGNMYITGSYTSDSLVFGSYTLYNHTHTHSYSYDMYAAKLNAAGNVLWAIEGGGNADFRGNSVAVDIADNVWISGMMLDTMTIGTVILPHPPTMDPSYIIKVDPATGAVVADMIFTSAGYNNDLATDRFGNIIWTGNYFSGTNFCIGADTLTIAGSTTNIFLAKYRTGESWETTGLSNATGNPDLIIYPNPAKGSFSISIPGVNDPSAKIFISNLSGQLAGTYTLCNSNLTISTATWPPGIYICKVVSKNSVITGKVVIE